MTMRDTPAASAASQQRWTPRTFTSNVRQKSFSFPMPAFATSRSNAPISAKTRATDSRAETSSSIAVPPISCATVSIWSGERAVTTTSQPSRASAREMFAPIPRPPPVTTALANCFLDHVQCLRVLERRQVARVGAERRRLQRAAHDLRRTRLRKRVDEEDPVRLECLAELRRDVRGDVCLRRFGAGQQAREDPGGLALDLVRDADRRGLTHGRMADRGRLELGRTDALAGDVQRVVGAP